MGTINYETSEYITLGYYPIDMYELENDKEFMQEIKEQIQLYGDESDKEEAYILDYISRVEEEDYKTTENIFNKYSFYYYDVKLKVGYYDGFYINIENNFGAYYDSHEDKKEVQKEITQIKEMLLELCENGMVSCYPSWCTGYDDYFKTKENILKAITEMREQAKETPTWLWYERNQHK